MDLASANVFSDNLTVFFQDDARIFDPVPVVLGTTAEIDGPVSVAAGDLDSDGDLDLISANEFTQNLTAFFQRASGSLDATPLVIASPHSTSAPFSIATGDIDGNGGLDLVLADADDRLTVVLQDSPGGFGSPSELLDLGSTDVVSVVAGDLDGDGDLDLASANRSGDSLVLLMQRAPGTFDGSPLLVGSSTTTDFPTAVAPGDFDADGDLDLVSTNLLDDTLTVFFQSAPGSFDPSPLTLGGSLTDGPRNVASADLDGDGDLDFASANTNGDTLTAFFQKSPGAFEPAPLVLGGPPTTDGAFFAAAGDLDGDGDLDLVSTNAGSHTATVFFQDTPGGFDPVPLVLGGAPTTSGPRDLGIADLDRDGDLDLVWVNLFSDNVTVFFQRCPGVFDPVPLALGGPPTIDGPVSVAAVDIDGDGDVDIVSGGIESRNLAIYWGGH